VAEQHLPTRKNLVEAARGLRTADTCFRNAEIFNPFTSEWQLTDFAVSAGLVIGTGPYDAVNEVDLKGRRVVPGLIDSHVHIESSLLCPPEFARLIAVHGTTTIIADPHEVANVCGTPGIEFMLSYRGELPVDLFIMLPSCVPATPSDVGGAILEAADLAVFRCHDGIVGLGEVMNVPGVLQGDPALYQKLDLFQVIDGHAPLLSGKDLSAYVAAGIQSDHECTDPSEVREKIGNGMFIYLREGSTEKNIRAIIPAVTLKNATRISFATDDRDIKMLVEEGHIDDCIRKAVAYGLEEETAIRMATLTAAERFGLHDRGALAPGRVADFCVLSTGREFRVEQTFRRGQEMPHDSPGPCHPLPGHFQVSPPRPSDIALAGFGRARVIGLVPHQIITRSFSCDISPAEIPDIRRDVLKAVVCSRYHPGKIATGLVHGFGISIGAIAGSVSHDAHNIVAVGVEDEAVCRAISLVIEHGGGLVTTGGERDTVLPLPCAGLMSPEPYDQVYHAFRLLDRHAAEIGAVDHAFMYLSFLALTVIPSLRITDRGLFDVNTFTHIPVFEKRT
jgi:adenine deaminase